MTKLIALVDCNNFFASCERLFRPDLKSKPVVVLSNNDGCFIARSNEAKKLGIPMGAPYFKYKDIVKKNNIACFSANFQLYGEISQRIMNFLEGFSPQVQVYSIDEAFLNLSHVPSSELSKFINNLSQSIYKNIGVPVTIGVAPTKTLSKLMVEIAKSKRELSLNYFSLSQTELINIFEKTPVQDVWGIGGRKAKDLKNYNIYTIKNLIDSDQSFIRKKFSVITERTFLELKGTSCIDLESSSDTQKSIISSRSFGKPISQLAELHQSISYHIVKSSQKLRDQGLEANYLSIYLKTSKYQPNVPKFSSRSFSKASSLPYSTSNPNILSKLAKSLADQVYQPNINYKKAGICLSSLTPKLHTQTSFIYDHQQNEKDYQLFQTIDIINKKLGKNSLTLASTGLKNTSWATKTNLRSPSYLSSWNEIPKVQ